MTSLAEIGAGQDANSRIAMAEFYSFLASSPERKTDWLNFRDYLFERRDDELKKIAALNFGGESVSEPIDPTGPEQPTSQPNSGDNGAAGNGGGQPEGGVGGPNPPNTTLPDNPGVLIPSFRPDFPPQTSNNLALKSAEEFLFGSSTSAGALNLEPSGFVSYIQSTAGRSGECPLRVDGFLGWETLRCVSVITDAPVSEVLQYFLYVEGQEVIRDGVLHRRPYESWPPVDYENWSVDRRFIQFRSKGGFVDPYQ